MEARRWVLARRPEGLPKDGDFRLEPMALPPLAPGEALIAVDYVSVDPGMRSRLSGDSYAAALGLGETIESAGVGHVVESRCARLPEGATVMGGFGWTTHVISDGRGVQALDPAIFTGPISPTASIGVLGIPGLTAYFGLTDIGKPKAGDVVLVSGAAGATGSVVGQIAKALGCTAIGIAGGKAKCDWVVGTAGFDACIDYKSEPVARRIRELAPKGVNVVFENVGGAILDAALGNLAQRARVVLCGGISSYNAASADEIEGLKNYMALTVTRSRMEGFIVLDYAPRFAEGVKALAGWIAEGRIKSAEDVQTGLENAPATLRRLFEGKNFGKQLLRL